MFLLRSVFFRNICGIKLSEGGVGFSFYRHMAADGTIIHLDLTHEEATDLFFRCLRSPDEDNPLSELVLSKLARAIALASEDDLRMSA
jgi:hypothetical protein